MKVIHHGGNGSYKTCSVIEKYIVPAIRLGRPIITNINGIDIELICKRFEIKETASRLIEFPIDTKKGLFAIGCWFHFAKPNSLIVIDEAQKVYRRGDKLDIFDSPEATYKNINEALEEHRHQNWDIVLTTPNIQKMHTDIRQNMDMAFMQVNLTGRLPWIKHQYNLFEHDPEATGKSKAHQISDVVQCKVDQRVFGCYKTTRTGKAKNEQARSSILKNKKLRLFAAIIIACICYWGYMLAGLFAGDNLPQGETIAVDQAGRAVVGRVDSGQPTTQIRTKNHADFDLVSHAYRLGGSVKFTDTKRLYFIETPTTTYTTDELYRQGYVFVGHNSCSGELFNNTLGTSKVLNCLTPVLEIES